MEIEFGPAKRTATLLSRGLDMMDAAEVSDGPHITFAETRNDYGELRFGTIGYLGQRMVVLAWTPRGKARRILSMRKANERERKRFGPSLGS